MHSTVTHLWHYLGEVFGDDGEGSAAHGKVEVLGASLQQPANQPLLQLGLLWRELEKQTTLPMKLHSSMPYENTGLIHLEAIFAPSPRHMKTPYSPSGHLGSITTPYENTLFT